MAILYDTYFVVALSFVLFFAVLYRYGVHTMALRSLDERAERIRGELEDAQRLREEAQELLASYERRQAEVEATANNIVEQARADAAAATKAAKAELEKTIDRRMRAAVDQIAAAEAAAMREVKNRAVEVAVAAAAQVLTEQQTKAAASAGIDASIQDVATRLNYLN